MEDERRPKARTWQIADVRIPAVAPLLAAAWMGVDPWQMFGR
ncbi:hypothetical protein [Arthrobacter sp. SRS-W-1-2016]|nr:hypothetical protein [Arthrobacter sp. SRS-W-1-2016]